MRILRVFLLVLTLFLTLSYGCGGGSTTPGARNLGGLEGLWDYTMVWSGILNGSVVDLPLNMTMQGIFNIGTNSITDDGVSLVWSYDGATLSVTDAGTADDWDPDCGNLALSGSLQMMIPCQPGATVANINGTANLTVLTQFCGDYSGSVAITGTMTKR